MATESEETKWSSTLKVDDEKELERRVAVGDAYEVSQMYIGHMARLRQSGKSDESEVG